MADSAAVYRLDYRGRYLGQDIVYTFHYADDRLISLADEGRRQTCRFIAERVHFFLTDPLREVCVSDLVFNYIRVTSYHVNPAQRFGYSLPLGLSGFRDPPGLPPGVAVTIFRGAGIASRQFRGWLHLAAYPLAEVTAGLVNTGGPGSVWDKLNAVIPAMRGDLASETLPGDQFAYRLTPVMAQTKRFLPGGLLRTQHTFTHAIRRELRTQRSRQPGHGRTG